MPAIELRNITKTYFERSWRTIFLNKKPRRVKALENVSLTVQPGEILGLLGPNGAGKTTLIKILATLIVPDSGYSNICGSDLCKKPHHVREIIGLVNTSERSFYWRLTGRQNMNFFASLYNLSSSERKRHIEILLDLVGLMDKAETPLMKYSSGQKQRLAIARGLLADPKVLLMDEPTNSLDPIAATELLKFTREKLVEEQGKTVVWCTHNLKEAEEICDRLAIIHNGKIIASGNLEYMKSLLEDESLYQLKVSSVSGTVLRKVGIIPISTVQNNGYMEFELREKEKNIPFLMKSLIETGAKVYSCKHKEIDLNELFSRLIKHESKLYFESQKTERNTLQNEH